MRPVTRVCYDCGARLKNRSRTTKRCRPCYLRLRAESAKGRTTSVCADCGKRLSIKRTITGRCAECYYPYKKPRGRNKAPAWNKGTSRFTDANHYKTHSLAMRRALWRSKSPDQRLSDSIRTLIRNGLRRANAKKHTKTAILLGCSTDDFRDYLESQFKTGMEWANYGNGHGKWNIDHIKPLTAFDLSNPEQQRTAFHYSNCQPLWAIENIKKGGHRGR